MYPPLTLPHDTHAGLIFNTKMHETGKDKAERNVVTQRVAMIKIIASVLVNVPITVKYTPCRYRSLTRPGVLHQINSSTIVTITIIMIMTIMFMYIVVNLHTSQIHRHHVLRQVQHHPYDPIQRIRLTPLAPQMQHDHLHFNTHVVDLL